MNRQPRSLTIVSWIFIIVGVVTFLGGVIPPTNAVTAGRVAEMKSRHPIDDVLVNAVRILAVVGGIFMLRRHNWARWMMVGWMALHVVLGAFHGLWTIPVHLAMFGAIGYFLFRPGVSAWFCEQQKTLLNNAGIESKG